MVDTFVDTLREFFSRIYTNVIVAVIILFVGIVLARLAGRLVHKLLHEIELDRLLRKATKIKFSLEEIIANLVIYFIYFITIVMTLDQLGVTTTVLHILSIAVIVFIIVSILIGIRDFFPNLIAGMFIHQKRFLKPGDHIRVGDVEGEVIEVSLVETRVKTKKDDIIYLPNSFITKQKLTKLKKKK